MKVDYGVHLYSFFFVAFYHAKEQSGKCPHQEHMPVVQTLIEMCLLIVLVEVDFAKLLWRNVQTIGNLIEARLDHEISLGPTEASECSVGDCISLTDSATNVHVRYVITTVDMKYCTFHDSWRKVKAPSSIVEEITV